MAFLTSTSASKHLFAPGVDYCQGHREGRVPT